MSGEIVVSTSAELLSALSSAQGGETIRLAPGDYGDLYLGSKSGFNVNFSTPVKITSADPANPAVFSGLTMQNASNIHFESVTFDYDYAAGDPNWVSPFYVGACQSVSFNKITFDGDLAQGTGTVADGYGNGRGLEIKQCSDVTVSESTFYNWTRGMLVTGSDNVKVAGNEMHSIRSDGMNFAEVTNVVVENNHLHDFKHSPDSGDHMDMIQFWTSGTDSPSQNIIIRGNVLDLGTGDWTQSIFMGNEAVDRGAGSEMYYQNVTIENNTIYNGHTHGITLGETNGLTIGQNTLVAVEASNPLSGSVAVPVINVNASSTNVKITGNVTGAINGHEGQTDWNLTGNVFIQNDNPAQPGYYANVFLSSTTEPEGGAHHYVIRPGGMIDTLGAGSEMIQPENTPDAHFHVYSLPDSPGTVVFDASATLQSIDPALMQGARFIWNFGDGTEAEGMQVQHSFADPGTQNVTLTLVTQSGWAVSTHSTQVSSGNLVVWDSQTGQFVSGEAMATAPTGGTGFKMSGDGLQHTVSNSLIQDFFGTDEFDISFNLTSDGGSSASGEIFRVHPALIVRVNDDGSLRVTMYTDTGMSASLQTSSINLLDQKPHDIRITFDGETDSLQIWIDGEVNAQRAITGDVPAGNRNLTFGEPWGGQTFDGEINNFSIKVEQPDYEVYTGDASKVPSVSSPVGQIDYGFTEYSIPKIDQYRLDSAAFNNNMLKDDASIVTKEGESAIALDGNTDFVKIGRLEEFETTDRLGIQMEFASTDGVVWGTEKLYAWAGGYVVAKLTQDDGLRITINGADGTPQVFYLNDIGIVDTDRHNLTILVDDVEDRLQVLVDGELLLDETDTDFELSGGKDWKLGGTLRNNENFDGEIYSFALDTEFEFVEPITVGSTDSMLV